MRRSIFEAMVGCGACLVALATVGCDGEEPQRFGEAWEGIQEPAPPADPSTEELEEIPPTSEIYGGAPVEACGWPTTVSMQGSCTGTLVHPQLVIYAAHCGSNYSSVRLGERVSGGGGRSVATQFCRTYPGGGTGNGNDFAFCKLAQPVNDVPIVPILMGCETAELTPGKQVTMVGFGNADNGPYGTKREVTTQINGITANNEAFIGGGGKDTCQGDSGGPVFLQMDDGSWRVFGITSYGGACGGGGYYSMMHRGVSWFESQSGLDLTPCHDANGNWAPTAACGGFPLDPANGSGTWANGCSGGPVSGASATCGDDNGGAGDGGGDDGAGDDGAGDDGAGDDGGGCSGCDTYGGSLSGTNDSEVQPDGQYYVADVSGQHRGELDGPNNADFDLYLFRWNGNAWRQVASSATNSPDELIVYNGTPGYYTWLVQSYSGSGSYTLDVDTP